MKSLFSYIIILFLFVNHINAQNNSKITIIPGEEYKAGTLHKLFFGELWREAWITPIEADILNIDSFAGGLKPLKKGGGFQTKSLRFIGADGKEYKFRGINKDPRKLLPAELQETFVADILKDQISTSNPYAPLVAAPIVKAMNILQAEPQLYFLPDHENLGEFRTEFANTLGTIEEHPEKGFGNAVKVKNTFDLFDLMEDDHDNRVEAAEYLKVRLIDIYIGDWDRHTDQWRWGRYDENEKHIWKPIPRDRDQAFSKYDGLFPWITAMSITQLAGFTGTYPKIADLTWSGRYVDRRILNSLTKSQWDSVTAFVLNRLTDSLIISAVRKLPRDVFAIEGNKLIFTLIQRKNRLEEASEIFYKNIMKYVEIRGSNKREFAEINRLDDENVSVKIFKRDKDTGEKKGTPFYSRTFNCSETKEIRVLLLGGDDYALVKGNVNSSIDVIINGGKGDNVLADSSFVRGYFLSIFPFIPDAETKTHFYRVNKKTEVIKGPSTSSKKVEEPEYADQFAKYEPPVHDYGHDWRFSPWFQMNSDVGIFIGGGPVLYEHGYLAEPFVYRMELKGGYAHKGHKLKLSYLGDFYSVFDNARLSVRALVSGLEVLNYFGSGNETHFNSELQLQDYYRVEQKQYIFNPSISFKLNETAELGFGTEILFSDTDLRDNSFIDTYRPYGINNQSLLGFSTSFTVVKMDHLLAPENGYYANLSATFYPEVWDDNSPFTNVSYDFRYYFPINLAASVIALKSSGTKIFGNYPFFKSAFLGGITDLKGYNRERFSGDGSLSFNIDLRTYLLDLNIIFPMKLGTVISADAGRVFVRGESSDRWHPTYGGGIYVSIINKDLTFSLVTARSTEDVLYYLLFGFGI
jgi:hypothetical protein